VRESQRNITILSSGIYLSRKSLTENRNQKEETFLPEFKELMLKMMENKLIRQM
jgi:hypothetical protein